MMPLLPTLSLKPNEGNVGGGNLSNQAHADQIKKGCCGGLVRARGWCKSGGLEHQSPREPLSAAMQGRRSERSKKKASLIMGERSFREPIKAYHTSPWVENCGVEAGETGQVVKWHGSVASFHPIEAVFQARVRGERVAYSPNTGSKIRYGHFAAEITNTKPLAPSTTCRNAHSGTFLSVPAG
jgi:hypothetical protein